MMRRCAPTRCSSSLCRIRWERVLEVVRERLLTPLGLRSLAPGHPDYKPKHYGDLRARDAAYHEGTVWAWLIEQLGAACVGSISEVFDAEPPFAPRPACWVRPFEA